MSFAENLVKARSHIVFLLGLATACAIIGAVELSDSSGSMIGSRNDASGASARLPLDSGRKEAALAAWRTFALNPRDGGYPRAVVLARRLGVAETEPPASAAAPPLSPAAALAVLTAIDAEASQPAKGPAQ